MSQRYFTLTSSKLQAIKKCAAEAAHRKTHNSDCCDTTFTNHKRMRNWRRRFYRKIKTLLLWFAYVVVSQYNLIISFAKKQDSRKNTIFRPITVPIFVTPLRAVFYRGSCAAALACAWSSCPDLLLKCQKENAPQATLHKEAALRQ